MFYVPSAYRINYSKVKAQILEFSMAHGAKSEAVIKLFLSYSLVIERIKNVSKSKLALEVHNGNV